MDFEKILKKYKDGNASKEEIELIEEELNKHEAIQEYLSQSYDIELENDISEENIKKETNFVKNTVNKKLRKVILTSVSIVFSILFTIFYIISPILNNFYYNPSGKTVSGGHEDLYFDLKVFTELNLPGYAVGSAYSESLGFGAYNIFFERYNLFNHETRDVNAKIKRNLRIGSHQDFFAKDHYGFYSIMEPDKNRDKFLEEERQETIEHIKKLNPVSYISAPIIFEKDLSLKEFVELKKKYNDKISFKWVGVRTEVQGKTVHYLSGFYPNFNDGSVSSDSADENKYPYLELVDYMTNENVKNNKHDMTEAYTKHFTSLLKYMNDRKKAVKALDHNSFKLEYYKNALDYVQKNGINIYGVLVYGEAKDLLQFINNEKIKSIEVDNVIPSKYTNRWG